MGRAPTLKTMEGHGGALVHSFSIRLVQENGWVDCALNQLINQWEECRWGLLYDCIAVKRTDWEHHPRDRI